MRGDITRVSIDAIVNAANEKLTGGGGVDGAIHKAAGPILQQELSSYDGCPRGQAVVTGGGNLPSRFVFHAVGPAWTDGQHDEPRLLASAYLACLEHAQKLGLESLAFPSISTGIYGYPIELAAPLALKTVADFLLAYGCPKRAVFVLFSSSDYEFYRAALQRL